MEYFPIDAQYKKTLVANTPQTVIDPGTINGFRIVNYTAGAIYFTHGKLTDTPVQGAPSDYIPAASGSVPAQYESPFGITDGLRVVGTAAGDITVIFW